MKNLSVVCFALFVACFIFSGCSNEMEKDAVEYIGIIKKAGFDKRTDPFSLRPIVRDAEVQAKGTSIRQKYSKEDYSKFCEVFEKKFRKEFDCKDEKELSGPIVAMKMFLMDLNLEK